MFEIFKKKENKKPIQKQNKGVLTRSFKGAQNSRLTQWFASTFTKFVIDERTQLVQLISRTRELAKNNEVFRSHLNNLEKSIIGNQGFRLQSLVKNKDGSLNEEVNKEIENAWWDFGKRSNGFITKDGTMGDIDFDLLILRTLTIDGEVFIRVHKDAHNPYGISFSIIDTLQIDLLRNRNRTDIENAIICGIEVDDDFRPVRYFLKKGTTDTYMAGKEEIVQADQIIHIYKKEFPNQVRGFTDICASMDSLKQLDDYAVAELFAAKVAAVQNVFYERNGSDVAGDWMDQQDAMTDDKGEFISEVSPGQSSIVPQGYTVKSLNPTHPNTNFSGFVKAIVRRIASAVGVSYNRLSHDYESVSYSSLREASIDEGKTYATLQRFLIDNWKDIEFKLWLKSYIINSVTTKLKPSEIGRYLDYQFIPRKDDLFDAAKDIVAVERRLKLGLTNPIIELERRGMDVDDVLDGWQQWKLKCEAKGLTFTADEPLPLDVINQVQEEINNPDKMDEENKQN